MIMPKISKSITVSASIDQVYKMWTTPELITKFFGREATIELEKDGRFEILFLMDQKKGLQGSEGCKVIDFVKDQHLSFTWNVPPQFKEERASNYQSIVRLDFSAFSMSTTHIAFENEYKEPTKNLDAILEYFDNAWSEVLNNLADTMSNKRKR